MTMLTTSDGAVTARRSLAATVAATLAGALLLVGVSAAESAQDAGSPSEDPLIANGGFEEEGDDGGILGWAQSHGTAGDGDIAVTEERAFEGARSLRIDDRDDASAFGLLSDPVRVLPDEDYELGLWVWLDDLGEPDDTIHGKAYLYFYDDQGTRVASVSTHFRDLAHEDWARVTLTETAPSDATSVSVLLYAQGPDTSTFSVDDVTLTHRPALEITDLGVGMETANVRLARTDVLPDGTALAYLLNNGSPLTLNVVDLGDGSLVRSHEIDQHTMISSAVVDDDHMFYFSGRNPSNGSLWRYDPVNDELDLLVESFGDETAVNDMIVVDDTVLVGTYPSAKVWAYDLTSGDLRDYGSLGDGGEYARRLTMVDDKLWVGTSTSPQLIELDLGTGEQSELSLPPDMETGADFFGSLSSFGDLVLARYSPDGESNASIYDREAAEWTTVNGGMGLFTTGVVDGSFYFARGDEVRAFDVGTRSERSIGWEASALAAALPGTTALSVVDLDVAGFGEATLVGAREDGALWRFNLESGHGDLLDPVIGGAPARIHSVGVGPDGNPHFGAYLSSGVLARVDHAAGTVEQLSGPSQVDGFASTSDTLVMGTYPDAAFLGASVHSESEWAGSPRPLLTVGRTAGQDRVSDMVGIGSRVAAVTVPNYGELGGALVLVDPHQDDHEIHPDLVPEQSLVSVAYRDGLIYGGSSIHGPINTQPSQEQAELFVWDVERAELVATQVVVEGAEIIHALAFDDAGRLWGMTDAGVLFDYDVASGTVSRETQTGVRNPNVWGRTSEIYQNPADGLMYGNAGSRMFRFDPETLDFEVLSPTGVRYSTVVWDGTVYFATETNIFRIDHPQPVPEVESVPVPVVFEDRPGTDEDRYVVPEVAGAAYAVDGVDLEGGPYPGSGTVTVQVRALPGSRFPAGAETEWSHTFSGDGGVPTDPLEGVGQLAESLAGYRLSGDVAGPIAHQTANVLEQATRHLEGERSGPARGALDRFVRHLDNPKRPDTLTAEARDDLRGQVLGIIEMLD